MRRVGIGAAMAAMVAAGCGLGHGGVPHPRAAGAAATPASVCMKALHATADKLLGASSTTAGALSDWQGRLWTGVRPAGDLDWSSYPRSQPATLCMVGAGPAGSCLPTSYPPGFACEDRAAIGVTQAGKPESIVYGRHDNWPIGDPPIDSFTPYSTSARALAACQGSRNLLLDAYDTTAGALKDWLLRLLGGSLGTPAPEWVGFPAGQYAALCFYAPPPDVDCFAATSPTREPCQDREAVGAFANGTIVSMTLGQHANWPPADPPIPK